MNVRRVGWVATAVLVLAAAPHAQEPSSRSAGRATPPGEVLRLFEAYALVQAQEALGLDDERYGAFVAGYRRLLEVRRQHTQARMRLIAELRRLSRREGAAEAELRQRLDELDAVEQAAHTEVRRARDAVEQALTTAERVRFRLFEEDLERRKLELLARVRQGRPAMRRPPG